VVAEAVEGAKAAGPLGSSSGRGLPQLERIRLNVHANQVCVRPRGAQARQQAPARVALPRVHPTSSYGDMTHVS
jgi:hypothetical protein